MKILDQYETNDTKFILWEDNAYPKYTVQVIYKFEAITHFHHFKTKEEAEKLFNEWNIGKNK